MTNSNESKPAAPHTPEPWRVDGLADNQTQLWVWTPDRPIANIRLGNDPDTDRANARRIVAAVNACKGLPVQALEEGVVTDMLAALREAQEEIEYWHADMLTEEEANHPRGSGWRRVRDKITAALARAAAA
jgi:hypothetical protein